ncbi:tRNA lysidine(34) synthetase TilS [Methylomonas sp. AM2-LC]|uniref:tRNA lysidine(34) synthetase TilS n=1 Tax=Methylomonas sp. AM2-LC TaxID=3153301 RepID=UPI00326434A5
MTPLSYELISQYLPRNTNNIYIAYSGGIDSHVLLHLLATHLPIKTKIIAVYVHHGLQLVADDWCRHCQQQCALLDVNFKALYVDAKALAGESPEAAARNARYAVLRPLIQADDVLVLAHHREDQLETLLLQLFRGSGIQGLAAMPPVLQFGLGNMLRPLLNISKQDIHEYANRFKLDWVEDPSNACSDFDRNYLRNEIVPLLKLRWPSLDKTIARTANHCAAALEVLDNWAIQQLPTVFDEKDHTLLINKLHQYSSNQRNCLLRYWFKLMGLKSPSQAVLETITQQVILAKLTSEPQVFVQGNYIRKYRQKLYCIASTYFQIHSEPRVWHKQHQVMQLINGSYLTRITSSQGIDQKLWNSHTVYIDYRRGGEKLKLPGRQGSHCLKKLYQEADMPPWERNVRPLIYLDDRLVAVAGLWIAEWAWHQDSNACYSINWQPQSDFSH